MCKNVREISMTRPSPLSLSSNTEKHRELTASDWWKNQKWIYKRDLTYVGEMVKDRAFSHSRTSTAANKFLPRKRSSSSIALYIIFLFAFSIFVFNYFSKDILEDEPKHPLPEESQSLKVCYRFICFIYTVSGNFEIRVLFCFQVVSWDLQGWFLFALLYLLMGSFWFGYLGVSWSENVSCWLLGEN